MSLLTGSTPGKRENASGSDETPPKITSASPRTLPFVLGCLWASTEHERHFQPKGIRWWLRISRCGGPRRRWRIRAPAGPTLYLRASCADPDGNSPRVGSGAGCPLREQDARSAGWWSPLQKQPGPLRRAAGRGSPGLPNCGGPLALPAKHGLNPHSPAARPAGTGCTGHRGSAR